MHFPTTIYGYKNYIYTLLVTKRKIPTLTSQEPSTQTCNVPDLHLVPSRTFGANFAMRSVPSARQIVAHGFCGSSNGSHVLRLPLYSSPSKALHCSRRYSRASGHGYNYEK